MFWQIISESVIGANHKRTGKPLQDAFLSVYDRDYLYVSIADGHGSPVCFRSDEGSKLAVLAAIELVKLKGRTISRLASKKEREKALFELLNEIAKKWSKMALDNLRSKPFTYDELDSLKEEHKRSLSTNALIAYGSTLSLAIMNKDKIYGFCLGDGDVLVKCKDETVLLDTEGDVVNGEATDSICKVESLKKAVYFEYNAKLVECLIMSTDGYKKSFESDDDFKSVVDDMYEILNSEGADSIKSNLADWLDETSIKGSGDDITACFLYK